jgi:hypothetical protein
MFLARIGNAWNFPYFPQLIPSLQSWAATSAVNTAAPAITIEAKKKLFVFINFPSVKSDR